MSAGLEPKRPTLFVFHVDDSTDDQVVFRMAAKKAEVPFSWRAADSAKIAIDYFDSLLKLSATQSVVWPDLVILDIVMPHDSGFTVLEYIKSKAVLRRIPVIIFTGHASKQSMEKAYSLGANSFMTKPSDANETVSMVGALYHTWSQAQRPTL